ncbi:MAG: hypothetical protein LAT55_10590 [Opitutales bacterium]|nr:hypothetical protein [Opitutales bacterium]
MKKILLALLFGGTGLLYSSEKREACQLWFDLSVPVQNAVNEFHLNQVVGANPRINVYAEYLSEMDEIIGEMVERGMLTTRKFEIPYDEKYQYWKVIHDFLYLSSRGFEVPADTEIEYWSLVHDFLNRLSEEYGAFVTGELLGIGVEAYFTYEWVRDESKKGEFFGITIRLPEDELKEFEKRFEALSD